MRLDLSRVQRPPDETCLESRLSFVSVLYRITSSALCGPAKRGRTSGKNAPPEFTSLTPAVSSTTVRYNRTHHLLQACPRVLPALATPPLTHHQLGWRRSTTLVLSFSLLSVYLTPFLALSLSLGLSLTSLSLSPSWSLSHSIYLSFVVPLSLVVSLSRNVSHSFSLSLVVQVPLSPVDLSLSLAS